MFLDCNQSVLVLAFDMGQMQWLIVYLNSMPPRFLLRLATQQMQIPKCNKDWIF
jgi:hypothetical protein